MYYGKMKTGRRKHWKGSGGYCNLMAVGDMNAGRDWGNGDIILDNRQSKAWDLPSACRVR